jgi:hypothetical protein
MQTDTMPANEMPLAALPQTPAQAEPAAASVTDALGAEKTNPKPSVFVLVFLFAAILALTAMNIYQDHVIRSQSFEIRWMMQHGTFHIDPSEAAAGKVPKLPLKQEPSPAAPGAAKP